jgi:hypothetical protein
MHIPVRLFCSMLLSVSLTLWATDNSQAGLDNKGSIAGKTYNNPALGMTIVLPGSWHLIGTATRPGTESQSKHPTQDTGCRGPLCGSPEIDVALEARSGSEPVYAIFLGGYKLSAEYQNRQRYPLKMFAESMAPGSMSGTGWAPAGDLTPIQLAGRPAYRLIASNVNTPAKKGFAYVSESNGYVFMLVGTAFSNPQDLQSAIENMKIAH